MDHINFWREFIGKVGAPIFAATLVASLLSNDLTLRHAVLIIGLGMMSLSHFREFH
jgi:hypothetical protein